MNASEQLSADEIASFRQLGLAAEALNLTMPGGDRGWRVTEEEEGGGGYVFGGGGEALMFLPPSPEVIDAWCVCA